MKVVKGNKRSVTIAAKRSIFGRLLVLAKSRATISLQDVLSYSESNSLAIGSTRRRNGKNCEGQTFRYRYFACYKTFSFKLTTNVKNIKNKTLFPITANCWSYLGAVESSAISPDNDTEFDAWIFDGMVIFQQLTFVNLLTFGDVSEFVLRRIREANTEIYFVTDQYNQNSIKSFERDKNPASED